MLFWRQSKSRSKYMFEWLIVSSLQFLILDSVKNDIYKTCTKTCDKEMNDARNHQ